MGAGVYGALKVLVWAILHPLSLLRTQISGTSSAVAPDTFPPGAGFPACCLSDVGKCLPAECQHQPASIWAKRPANEPTCVHGSLSAANSLNTRQGILVLPAAPAPRIQGGSQKAEPTFSRLNATDHPPPLLVSKGRGPICHWTRYGFKISDGVTSRG